MAELLNLFVSLPPFGVMFAMMFASVPAVLAVTVMAILLLPLEGIITFELSNKPAGLRINIQLGLFTISRFPTVTLVWVELKS